MSGGFGHAYKSQMPVVIECQLEGQNARRTLCLCNWAKISFALRPIERLALLH